jgi:methylglutaconyl-CoA hydratase
MRYLRIANAGSVRTLTLARPEAHNALDDRLIGELTEAASEAGADPSVRVVVLRGEGPSFCIGADVKFLQETSECEFLASEEAGRRVAAMFHAIAHCPQPVVVAAHGSVLGGGAALVCAGDIAIGHRDSTVAFAAVRLGIVAAVTAPFVERRVGPSEALHLCLTGRRISGEEAHRRGIFHYLTDDLDAQLREVVAELLLGAPQAHATTKRIFQQLPRVAEQDLLDWTARENAIARRTDEGLEGLRAAAERRAPGWHPV